MDAVREVIDFGMGIAFEDIPPDVIERTRLAFLDTLGVMLAGVEVDGVPQLSRLIEEWGGASQASLITSGRRVPMHAAALVNGVAARAWDLDDCHEQNTCHVFASVIPTLLALAQGRPVISGKQALAAAAVAGEVVCRLSKAPRATFSETGSSMTYQCPQLSVALMTARLLGLSKNAAQDAMGIAYARLSGNQQGFHDGAMTVRLMQGISSEIGVSSALMAEKGMTGSTEILEGKFGYFQVYHRGKYNRSDIVDGLGRDWLVPEVSIKPVSPNCKYTHAPIAAAIDARSALGSFKLEDVESIVVKVSNREVHDVVCLPRSRKWAPETLTDAQFSLPFALAHAVAHGRVNFDSFLPQGLRDERVRRLMPLVHVEPVFSHQGTDRGTFPMPGVVTISLRDGREVEKTVTYVKGHPRNPMSFTDVAEKFTTCASLGRPRWTGASSVVDAIASLHLASDVASLMDAMAQI
jgi:2-methylcitrate dehydratase PrpD